MGKHKKSKAGTRMNPISEGASGGDGPSDSVQARPSLGDQLISDRVMDPSKYKARNKSRLNKSDQEPEFIDEKMTQKILKSARRQQKDLQDELFEEEDFDESEGQTSQKEKPAFKLGSKEAESGDESDLDEFAIAPKSKDHETEEIDPEDEKALELFMNKNAEPSRTLADLIMEKFTEKQTELESQFSEAGVTIHRLDPRVEKMYEGVRDIVCKYRSGKLPKAFKLIPRLTNWEQVLHITDPGNWSAAAMYQATRIFTSNLKEKMAQRFFNLVLLPRVRDDIMEYKKLNYHLYQALRKALFKPGAFMKGILIPLCESGTCTLREAVIIGSVLSKNSIPILHSSAAMLKIAEMDYSGANSLFLRIFFDKKYALPYRVIDAVVYHFLKFERDPRELPVLWHQSLLVFVQRYKEYMSSEQNEAIQALLRKHTHHQITAEIRRELANCKSREDVLIEQTQNSITRSINDIRMDD